MTDYTLTQITHYQKKLEKYAAGGEIDKILCCIHKLKYLPVTVNHLEVTGIGKSINSMRHQDGTVGEKARALVQKWKTMVAEEEEDQSEEMQTEETEKLKPKDSYSKCSPTAVENEEEYDPSDEGDRLQIQEELDNTISYNPGGNNVEVEEENCNGYDPKTSREDYLLVNSETDYDYNPSANSKKLKYGSPARSSMPNGDTHSPNIKTEKSIKSEEESKHKKKKHKSRHDHEDKHKSSEDGSSNHRKPRHKSSSKSKDKKKDKNRESSKLSSQSSSSKSHSSSHKSKDLSVESSPPVNSSSSHGCSGSSNPKKRARDSEDECERSSKKSRESEINSGKQKDKKSHRSSRSDKEDHSSSKRKREDRSVDLSSGFEAALMGMDDTPSKKKKKKKSKEKEKKETAVESPTESPICSSSKVKKEFDLECRDNLPTLPSNMEEEEASLPQLMTHYKPLPHLPQKTSKDPFPSQMSNEEALNYMFSSKNNKQRRIYAGKATVLSSVPSLFNICIRVLQENIDALEVTGGIPFDILRPVLERASPQQLFILEDYNPYLLEDSDVLWASHCRKTFRNKQREDMETWRELFIRSTDEHQEKMRSITENLQKKYITKAPPKRTTQLAFINTAAKPPKSVARAQARYGTASVSSHPVRSFKPDEQQKAGNGSSTSHNSSSNAILKPDRPFPNKPPAIKKPKVAPLMGKARQLMKKVCRR